MPINYDDYRKKYKNQIETDRKKRMDQFTVDVSKQKEKNSSGTVGSKIGDLFSNFDDGYDFGDVTKTILKTGNLAGNTIANTGVNVVRGLGDKLEGLYDFMYDTSSRVNEGASNLLGITTDSEYKANREKAQDWIERDLLQEGAKKLGINEEFHNYLDRNSLITRENIGGQVAQGVGGMLPEIALALTTGGTSAVGSIAGLTGKAKWLQIGKNVGKSMLAQAPANVTLATGVYGQSIEEAYKSGATDEEAMWYGIGKSAVEITTEWLTGGIPGTKGTGLLDDLVAKNIIDKSTKSITKEGTKELIKSIEKAGFQVVGEGAEEAIAEMIDPFLKNATYSEGETIDWENVIESAIVGGITGGILNAPSTVSSVKNAKEITTLENEVKTLNKQLNETTDVTEKNNIQNKINEVKQEIKTRSTEDIAPVQTQQEQTQQEQEIAPIQNEQLNTINTQINELENQLDTTQNATQQSEVLNQIKELENQYNAVEQQEIAKAQNEISNTTTQEEQTNLTTEPSSNTPNIDNYGNLNYNIGTKEGLYEAQQTSQENPAKTTYEETNKGTSRETIYESVQGNKGTFRTTSDGVRILETNDGQQVLNGINKIVEGMKSKGTEKDFSAFVTPHTVEDYSNAKTFYSEDGLSTVTVEPNGDVVSVISTAKGRGTDLLLTAIENGGNRLDNYGSIKLAMTYQDVGFEPVARVKFADEYAPDNWNYERDGRPDILVMKHNGDNADQVKSNLGKYGYVDLDTLPYMEYDEAIAYRDSLIDNEQSGQQAITQVQEQEIAPIKAEINDLTNELKQTVKDTKKELKSLTKEINNVKTTIEETKALTEKDLPIVEQEASNNLQSITDDLAPTRENTTPETDNFNNERTAEVVSPLEDRTLEEVGSKKVKAYQYEHPEVRPYFQQTAQEMLGDLKNSVKGVRMPIYDDVGNMDYVGTTRETTQDIADLLDSKYNYSYADIEKGLNAIIEDNGKENIAVAKRIEFALDERLRNGYTSIDGLEIPPNQEYINLLKGQEYTNYYNNIQTEDIAPIQFTEEEILERNKKLQESSILNATENHPPLSDEFINELNKQSIEWARESGKLKEVAPIKEQYEAITPINENVSNAGKMIRVNPEMETTQVQETGTLEDTSVNQQQFNTETEEITDSTGKKTKKEIKQQLLRETGILNESLDSANNIPKLLMENTDPIRLQEIIFGRDLGNKVNNMFFQKVKDNTSEKIRFQNKERQEIKDLGIKARSKESEAVQKYGEKQYVNELGETIPYGDNELSSEFKDVKTQEKIKRASEIIRSKYDNYIDTTNEVLTNLGYDAIPKRKDYMRHFQELTDIFSRLGIPYNYNEMTANDLPTDINGLTADFSPSKNFFASTLKRKGNKTTYDAITGIDGYLEGIGNLIYHTEDIQRLRAYEQYIRDTYGENHGFDNIENLSTEEKVNRIEKIQDNHLSNYASWLHEYTNTLAGKKALIDRSIEGLTGRKIYSFLNTTKTQVGRNMIGFNLSSAMTNGIAGVQALSKTNKLSAVKGLADTVKNVFIKDGFAEKNNFLTSRFGSDRLSKNLWQKVGDAGFVFMQGTDNFISNFVVRSKYNELKSKGLSDEQAHIESGKFASRLMSDRSQGATANIYNSQMLGLVTQFQNEVNNQLYSMFYDTYHESKDVAKGSATKTALGMTYTLGQMAVLTHLFGTAFEKMAGYNPTFDIIGMFMKGLGFDDDEEDEDTTSENVSQAFSQLINALPYVNILTGGGRIPVSEAFTGVTDSFKALTGGQNEYGQDVTWEDALKSVKESAPYLLLPFGYSQIKKTTKGLGMYDEELPVAGSYTDSGNLRFTADDSDLGKLQAGIFGQWASESAKDYVKSDFKSINAKNVDELVELGMNSTDYRNYRTGLSKQKKLEDKIDYISDLDVPISQKNIMANNVLDRDYDVDMGIYNNFGSFEEFDYSYKNPEKYKLAKAITDDYKSYDLYKDDIWDLKADKDEEGKSISGSRKAKVISYVNGLDLTIPQKAMLIRQEYSSFDEYNNDIVDYVNGLELNYEDKISILQSLDMEVMADGSVRWEK